MEDSNADKYDDSNQADSVNDSYANDTKQQFMIPRTSEHSYDGGDVDENDESKVSKDRLSVNPGTGPEDNSRDQPENKANKEGDKHLKEELYEKIRLRLGYSDDQNEDSKKSEGLKDLKSNSEEESDDD